MDDVTLPPRQCPRCGRTLTSDAPEGLCSSCLLAAGTETLTGSAADDAPTVLPAWDDSAASDGDGQRLVEGQVWGPYRIGRLLGRGGMGEVYEAEHTETGRRIALKVLRSQLRNAEDRARFLREGQLAASVSHPHTVYIFGSEEISGMPVISMELLPGGTLKDRVTAQGPFRPTDAVAAVLDIVGGLDAAQSVGILHRDIKPSNCFIDSEGSVKVGDFGLSISTLARDVRHELATGGFQGTPQFAPPEQLRGEPLDVRADIYAVGATLYYLLTGQTPFDARDLRDLFARVTTEPPKSPRLVRPEIPSGLASVVVQCLAKSAAQRPPSYAALADALRPFSSFDEAPARPGLRVLAGAFDLLVVGLPVAVWLAWTVGSTVFTTNRTSALTASPWTLLLNAAYYFCLEGFWGTSLGKRIFGLRVTSTDGAASWRRIARRTAVFFVPHVLLAFLLPIAGSTVIAAFLVGDVRLILAGGIAASVPAAALFLSARRHNGWAALHDLASGTRVDARMAAGARRIGTAPTMVPALARAAAAPARVRYGPFTVVSDAALRPDSGPDSSTLLGVTPSLSRGERSSTGGDTGSGGLLIAFDPILRRQVWIHAVSSDTPAISAARRDVGRVGRLHWLTGQRSADDNWDAFEAPDGGPFLSRQGPAPEWPTLKLWLLDLANELTAAERDGSVPVLGLDRVWIRNDGRLVLLDFPARPGTDKSRLTPVGLLSAVANHALSATASTLAEPPLMPLPARALLTRWSGSAPPSLDAAHKELIGAVAVRDRVSAWQRAVPIGLASAPAVLMLAFTLLIALPAIFRFFGPEPSEMLDLLESLYHQDHPAGSRMADPEIRSAVERYVAGRHRALLNDESFWSSAMMQGVNKRLRRTKEDVATRYPSVSADDLARASAVIAPDLAARRAKAAKSIADVSGPILGVLTAIALLFVMVLSVVSSVVVPGGVVTRLLGLAVTRRGGMEIGRWRSLGRVLVAWLPAIAWLLWLAAGPKIQGFVPTRAASIPVAGLMLGALAIGAAWVIARPTRGPHDWLAGTWVVPR